QPVVGPPSATSPQKEYESRLHTPILYPIAAAYYACQTLPLSVDHAIIRRYPTRRIGLYFPTSYSPPDNPAHPLSSYPHLLPTIDKPLQCCLPTSHKTNLRTVDQPLLVYVRHNGSSIEKTAVFASQQLLPPPRPIG